MTKPRRRQAGEGGISEYATKAGPRYLIKYTGVDEHGGKKVYLQRGFTTRPKAAQELRDRLSAIDRGVHVAPNRVTVAEHMAQWLDGLRKEPSTVASYRKNVRLHVTPHIGALRLTQLTGGRLTKLYRELERAGRVDGTGGLSARTTLYIHTIIHSSLGAAVRDGLLVANPADKADPPSAKAAAAPEMRFWSADQLRAFLDWNAAQGDDDLAIAWVLLAATAVRRGEALGLRWGDVDFEAGRISVRRSFTAIRQKGEGEQLIVGPPKTARARVIDVDEQTLAALKAHKTARGGIALSLARDDAYVLGNADGTARHPERFSRRFIRRVAAAQRELGDELPSIRLHDVRHTHASLLLAAGVPVKVVSERLGHASAMITLGVYAHTLPSMQAEAAAKFGSLLAGRGVEP
jgi:integrase